MSRGSTNYIPRPDADFTAWATQYLAGVQKFWSQQGLDDGDLVALEKAVNGWLVLYPAHIKAQAAAEAARQTKDGARTTLEAEVRPITNFIQSFSKTANSDRAAIGITVRSTSRTAAAAPTTRPLALVDAGSRLQHQLRLVDESTPTRRGRPAGVLGAEVWVTLVPSAQQVPTDPQALSFLTMTTKPTLVAEFKAGDGGKTAVYMTRWVNTRGEKGPWSEIATATVAA